MNSSQSYLKETKSEQEAICWTEKIPKSDNIPKLNIHEIFNNKIKNLNTTNSKLTDTAKDDYRSIYRDPIFEVHTVSKDGKTTDYSYIKLNATEYDANDTKNPYKRKTYSIGFTHSDKIEKNSCFKYLRKYSPMFVDASSQRSNLGAAKTISYDMLEKIVEAIGDFANDEKLLYCRLSNNHEDFIYKVSKKAGIPGYASTFSSFWGLSRHNLYKRQLKDMEKDESSRCNPIYWRFFGIFKKYFYKWYMKKANDKRSFFEYFSELGSSNKYYKECNKVINCLKDQLVLNKSSHIETEINGNENLICKGQEVKLSGILYILSSLIEGDGKFLDFYSKVQSGLLDLSLSDEETKEDYDITDYMCKYYIHDCLEEKLYDKALMYKSVQRNLISPIFEKKRSELLLDSNNVESVEYITNKKVISNEVYIPDSQISTEYTSEGIKFKFNVDVKDKPLFSNGGPKINDIGQTILGDCYLMSSLISMVSTEKGREFIKDAVIDNGNGTVTVTFFGEGRKIKVDKTVPTEISEKNALWVQMIEKAYAASNCLGYVTDRSGYNSIKTGDEPGFISRISEKPLGHQMIQFEKTERTRIEQVLGKKFFRSTMTQTESYSLVQFYIWKLIDDNLKGNRNIFFHLFNHNKGSLMDHHSYTIIGCEKIGSHYFFKVVNPWYDRVGPRYFDIENLRSKITFYDTFEKEGYFLLELSSFTDLVDYLLIV